MQPSIEDLIEHFLYTHLPNKQYLKKDLVRLVKGLEKEHIEEIKRLKDKIRVLNEEEEVESKDYSE